MTETIQKGLADVDQQLNRTQKYVYWESFSICSSDLFIRNQVRFKKSRLLQRSLKELNRFVIRHSRQAFPPKLT
jgi:hypothetical protein